MTQDIELENFKKSFLKALETDNEFVFRVQRLLGIDDIESKFDRLK